MREKLIDLLMDTLPEDCPWEGNIKGLVDHLIANGVTILPALTMPELTEEQIEELRERLRDSRPQLVTHNLEPQIVVVNKQQWIPVSERLPENIDTYIVVVKHKYYFEKEYSIDTDVALYNPYEGGYIDNHWNTFNDWDEGQQYLRVTHWMPMPEPPKEG